MRKSYVFFALIFFMPLFSYLFTREYVKHSHHNFICKASIAEKTYYEQSGNIVKIKGELTFDFKQDEIRMSIYNFFDGALRWRGVFSFKPEYDMNGRIQSLNINTVRPSISSLNLSKVNGDFVDTKLVEGNKYSIRIYKVGETKGIYFFKYANNNGFCINEDEAEFSW